MSIEGRTRMCGRIYSAEYTSAGVEFYRVYIEDRTRVFGRVIICIYFYFVT